MDYTIFIMILVGVIVLVMLYYLFLYLTSNVYLVSSVYDLKMKNTPFQSTEIKNVGSIRYTYSIWIYVNNMNTDYGADSSGSKDTKYTLFSFEEQQPGPHHIKNIDIKDNTEEFFSLYFLKNSAQLNMHIKGYQSSADYTTNSNTITPISEITISSNFPLQKWTNVIVSVDTAFIDIYMDGNLVKSVAINSSAQTAISVPTANSAMINFGSGQDIKITRLLRLPYQIDPGTAYSIYAEGNGVSNSSFTHFNVWYSTKDASSTSYVNQKNMITV